MASKMNDGKIRVILDKFENMEKIPQSFMNELAEAIRQSDGLKSENEMLIKKNRALQCAFEYLMELHQELRVKTGGYDSSSEMTYHIYEEFKVLDLEE